MPYGNVIVEQVNSKGEIENGLDLSLSPREIFSTLKLFFPNLAIDEVDHRIYVGNYKQRKYAIRCKNITYLGIPHPIYKKRIQISDDLFDFNERSKQINATPILLGIYAYSEKNVFASFGIETYIKRKAHNSSAHVYTSDIQAAVEDGIFQKVDYFGNDITVFRDDYVDYFLDGLLSSEDKSIYDILQIQMDSLDELPTETQAEQNEECPISDEQKDYVHVTTYVYNDLLNKEVIPQIETFIYSEKRNWNGIDCYTKMVNADYRNCFQPEWAGFFLEFEFENFIRENGLEHIVTYAQDKTDGGIDLDLYFPSLGMYGDLKAHSDHSRGIQGNDLATINTILNQEGKENHIYYVVCEHSTNKDKDYGNEVTIFWNTLQKKDDLLSYANKMKHDITIQKMYILDINKNNQKYLSIFRQGINSNGKPREPKIMIEQKNLEHFIIKEIDLSR